jgi:steroid delta-isomerase-like uncharacterized protein
MGTEWFEEYLDAWNSHDAARVATFIAEDGTYEDLALGQRHEGRDDITSFIAEASQFSSDYRFASVSAQASGDRYALEWEMTGTNTGAAGALPATNKPYRIRGVSVGRLNADGKIAENRDYWNLADYLMQVGLLPPPGG